MAAPGFGIMFYKRLSESAVKLMPKEVNNHWSSLNCSMNFISQQITLDIEAAFLDLVCPQLGLQILSNIFTNV